MLGVDDELRTNAQLTLRTTHAQDTDADTPEELVRSRLRRELANRILSGDGIDRDPITLDASKGHCALPSCDHDMTGVTR
jgi:Arc/MetJ family transcription regulator